MARRSARGFERNFEVQSISLGYGVPQAGQLALTPVTITKLLDSGSAALLQAGAEGRNLGTLTVSSTRTSPTTGTESASTIHRLQSARIVDYCVVDSKGSSGPVEQLTILV